MCFSGSTFGGSCFGGGCFGSCFCANAPAETTQHITAAVNIRFNFSIITCGLLISHFHVTRMGGREKRRADFDYSKMDATLLRGASVRFYTQ